MTDAPHADDDAVTEGATEAGAGAGRRPPSRPPLPPALDAVAIVLAAAAGVLLLGAVLFAFASASAGTGDVSRFRLLGQAANPFVAVLAVAAAAVVVLERRNGTQRQVAAPVALGVATAVSVAVVLLGLNGVITDFTANVGGLFRASNLVSRLGTVGLAAYGLWLSATAPAPPGGPPPAAR